MGKQARLTRFLLVATVTCGTVGASAAWAATSKRTTTTTAKKKSTAKATTTTKAATTTAAASGSAAPSENSSSPAGIVKAADAFLATLNAAEKKTVLFAWTDTAQKQRWSNFPAVGFKRAGLRWGDLTPATRDAWLSMMKASLSAEGFTRIMAQFNADEVVFKTEGQAGFGVNEFFVALIGKPTATDPWMWQFGGHHVTVNATVVGGRIVSLTPSYMGAQPLKYTDANGKTVRPLGDIEDEGFALVNSLDATQKKAAVLSATPIDVVLGPGQDGKKIPSEGLLASKMTAEQQSAMLKLIGHYTGLVNDADAASRSTEIKANLDQTFFAWFGPTSPGTAAYLRVTGPTLVIEYAPQGDRPGSAVVGTPDHAHGIYRDPTNDYGAKFAK